MAGTGHAHLRDDGDTVIRVEDLVVEFKLDPEEQALFDESASHVKDLVDTVVKMFPDLA